MKLRTLASIALVTAMWTGPTPSQDQKPVRVINSHADGGLSDPKNLDQLLDRSALVIEGVVEASRPADKIMHIAGIDPARTTITRTAFRVRIQEVFRGGFRVVDRWAPPAETVEIVGWHIGDRDRGSHVERFVNDFLKPLTVGQQVLLFLKREFHEFYPTTDDDGSVFDLQGESVVPRKPHAPASRIARDGWPRLQAILRSRRR